MLNSRRSSSPRGSRVPWGWRPRGEGRALPAGGARGPDLRRDRPHRPVPRGSELPAAEAVRRAARGGRGREGSVGSGRCSGSRTRFPGDMFSGEDVSGAKATDTLQISDGLGSRRGIWRRRTLLTSGTCPVAATLPAARPSRTMRTPCCARLSPRSLAAGCLPGPPGFSEVALTRPRGPAGKRCILVAGGGAE